VAAMPQKPHKSLTVPAKLLPPVGRLTLTERTDNMFELNFSSNADRMVAFLLACAILVVALV
jgi:hypothetical protein